MYSIYQALMISGGAPSGSVGTKVEVYVPSTGQHCSYPDMPIRRYHHSLETDRTVCGGAPDSGTPTSCIQLNDLGVWETKTTGLLEER